LAIRTPADDKAAQTRKHHRFSIHRRNLNFSKISEAHMINPESLGQGLAANLLETSPPNAEVESLIFDAFRRGLTLGMTLRRLNDRNTAPQPTRPSQQDDPPCARIH
jgi:hypothetical protein